MSAAILGISAFYHDSAAAIVVDGKIIAAAHEERFTRKKHDSSFPLRAVNYVLDEAGIPLRQAIGLLAPYIPRRTHCPVNIRHDDRYARARSPMQHFMHQSQSSR